jgi:inorganic pyrophosphatase
MASEPHMKRQEALEYDIFVPQVQASGQRYTEAVTRGIKEEITTFFGGITDTRYTQEGLWKVGGMTIRDELVIWRVLSDKGAAGDAFMQDIRKRLEEALQQELILVVRRRVETLGQAPVPSCQTF